MSEEVTLDEFADSSDSADTQKRLESRFWGEVPDHWELVNGSDVYEVNPNPKPNEEPNTYIEMDALDTELPYPEYFGERNASEYSGKTFTKGDTLFARITPCTENGKAALVPEMDTEVGIGSTEYAVLSPRTDRINSWLLYYLSKSHPIHNYAISRMRGSTGRQRVPFSVFRRELDIALPPLSEQRKIATVLYNIDQAIEKTESVIRHYEDLQTGLLRKHFGKSSVQIDYPEERVDKRLGPKTYNVPEDWEVVQVADIGEVVTGDTPSTKNKEYYGGDLPFVTPEDFGDTKRVHRGSRRLTDEGREKARPIPEDAVMMDCIGMDMGKVRIAGREIATNQQINSVIVNTEEMLPEFLYFHLKAISNLIQSQAGQTRTPIVSKSQFSSFEIFNPPISTQRDVVNSLNVFDDLIEKESEYATQLRRLKRGLMQDLLSGTVRTTDTNIPVPEEITRYG